jgi:glycogen debranching enzyme
MSLTILEGSTFCVCDHRGDFGWPTSGFFAKDVRFLSVYELKIDGETPLLLSSDQVEYFSAAFYLRNPRTDSLALDVLSIARERFVGDGMQDRVHLVNHAMESVSCEVALRFGSDFADIFSVKDYDFALGDPDAAEPLPPLVEPTFDAENNQFLFVDPDSGARTQVILSEPGDVDDSTIRWRVQLAPRASWSVRIDVSADLEGDQEAPRVVERRFGEELLHVRESLAAWKLRVPQLRTGWDDLHHSFNRSIADLASLRIRNGLGSLPAAGMPWFMTVFGRDTLITCLQTLLFGPELARSALEVLANLQATEDIPALDAEPGKIVHEVRHGKAAKRWFEAYYGTADATPLYLILLSEVWRWTDDAALVRSLREPALNALGWIDDWGDLDGDGFVEYKKRSPGGLDNQSWKDSGDSMRFSDGRIAEPPIAPCEVQGYVYDAKVRTAELAREVWRDRALAERLDRDAAELKGRFDEAFWCDDGYYALALDRDKQRVDSLTSNIGHLLWSGIVPDARVEQLVDSLMGDSLWSGWGVRTMSRTDAAYNPLSYHNGTVWPHDNSLCAAGLARYGRWSELHRLVRRMLAASRHFDHQLPEVFAGMPRADTPFPIRYPTAARPQAWAAGTPVLLLQLLLGLEVDRGRHQLRTNAPELPVWADTIKLAGIRAFERAWDVTVENGRVSVTSA